MTELVLLWLVASLVALCPPFDEVVYGPLYLLEGLLDRS